MQSAMKPLIPATPRPPGQPRGLNILGTFAHHPELATAFWVFNGHILNTSTLTARQTELAVLRVALRRGSVYEWQQHLYAARACGILDEEIAAIASRDGVHRWSDADDALLTAVDELLDNSNLSDETWATLSASMDTKQIIDLIFTVGAYVAIAMLMGVAGIALDDDLRRDARPFPPV
jgi:alkylhydroperoxidase family enzyme